MKNLKRALSLLLSVLMVLGVCSVGVSAQEGYLTADGFANQWARSDLRAWMNGLTKADGNLPVDGSNGTKGSENFLNSFTDAELALFQPETVITNVFNDSAVLDSSDDDKALTRTTSIIQTKDRFWPASGLLMRNHVNAYEDQLISADPGYDLGNYYTYKQKVTNGKVNKWANIVPVPFWSGSGYYYDGMYLRSASYENTEQVAGSDSGYNVEGHGLDDGQACACGRIALPSGVFAAMAVPGESTNGSFIKKEIASYANLGKKNYTGSAPLWGMYLKKTTLDDINGTLIYNSGDHTLTFASEQALPQGKTLMVQVYKNWDWSKETDVDGAQPETQNARVGDTVFTAGKEITSDGVTSATFTFTGSNTPDLNGYTVKVWLEQEATNDSLAQVSNPLTFSVGANESVVLISETKSLNPRVFAYKSDLACSWGVYNNESECTFISHGEEEFHENIHYEGTGATYQKLYIGTDSSSRPIEWWIAGRSGDTLTLYQCSGTQSRAFNDDTLDYEGTVRNPSLYLKSDFTIDDIEDFIPKVILSEVAVEQDDPSDCDGEFSYTGSSSVSVDDDNILDVPADKLSLQFCKTNGSDWTDAPGSSGDFYVRVAFAGATIDGVEYAPCFSNVRKINYQQKPDPGMELTISPEQPVWGDDITITATLPENATGTVTFRFDEADTGETVTVENGKAVYAIEGKSIEVGDYTVLASYSGDERYISVSEELPFAVKKAETEVHITVEPENPLSGQDVSITATVDGDAKIINFTDHGLENNTVGGVTLKIDGVEIASLASETNTVTFNIPGLDAGERNIYVIYNGDEHYESTNAEKTIFVGRSEPEITVTAEDITYGEAVQATVTVPDNATGNITVGLLKYGGIDPDTNEEIWNAVNGAPASITSGEQFEISGLAAGDYKLKVSLGEDSNYFSGSAEKTFKVNKAEPDMSVTVDPQTPVADGDFTVTTHLPSDAQGNVIYRFSDVDLLGYTTVTNGEAPFDFECLRSGTYHGTAKYLPADGSNYAEKEITFEFNVSAADPNMTLTAPDVDYGKTATVTANLPLNAMWCDVTFYLDGEETGKSVYVSQGKAVCEYTGLSIGEHTVKAKFSGDDRYFSVTKEISFTVNSVDCALTINYVYADGTEAAETYTDSVEIFKAYSVTSPEIEGYTPDITTVEGTMSDEDMGGKTVTVTYTANTYKVTYVVDGEKLTEMDATFGQSVPRPRTPQREGYTFKWVDEIPATMPAQDVTINGKFTVIEYTATFVDEAGETVEKVKFTVEDECITEPDVPEKAGYAGEWEEYTLGTSDITIKPVYANITSIQIEDYEENSETGYKEDKTFTVKAEDLPEGAEIHWFVNGEDVGTGESYTVEDPTDDYNIYAEVIDKDGNTLDTTKIQSVKVRNGFFDRLKAFFAELIEKILGKAIADLLSSVC